MAWSVREGGFYVIVYQYNVTIYMYNHNVHFSQAPPSAFRRIIWHGWIVSHQVQIRPQHDLWKEHGYEHQLSIGRRWKFEPMLSMVFS